MNNTDRKRAGESNIQYLRRSSRYFVGSFWEDKEGGEFRVLKLQVGRGGAYGLLEYTKPAAKRTCVMALVLQMKTSRGDTQIKAFSDLDGPNMISMPEALLNQLTYVDPLDFSADQIRRSTEWRAKCRKALTNRAELARPGVKFTTTPPMSFGASGSCDEFEVENLDARIFVGNPGTPERFRCRMSAESLDNLSFTVHP